MFVLPNEELLCVIRGQSVLKLNKFDFAKRPMSKKICCVSTMDYNPSVFPHTDLYKPPDTDTHSPTEMIHLEKSEKKNPIPDLHQSVSSTAQLPRRLNFDSTINLTIFLS